MSSKKSSSLLFSTDFEEDAIFAPTTLNLGGSTSSGKSGVTSSSQGLSSLFSSSSSNITGSSNGGGVSNTNEGNKSLTYQPPKQPSQTATTPVTNANTGASSSTAQQQQPSLIFAIPIQLFQFDAASGKFVTKGKVGAAILGNKVKFQLLLYVTNNQHICVTSIGADFSFTIQNNLYGSFYDDTRQNWSLLFRTQEECIKFTTHVALARAASAEFRNLIQQDILVGPKGKGVGVGDIVRVKYTGWLCDNTCQIGSVFDTNSNDKDPNFKFKIGEGSVIKGWEEGVKGMKKSGKRIIVVPSELGYGKNSQGSIPPNSPLLFEVEVVGVKRADRERTNSTIKNKELVVPEVDETFSNPNEDIDGTSNARPDLLSRMAKLGRPAMGGVMITTKSQSRQELSEEEAVESTPVVLQAQPPTSPPVQPTPIQNILPTNGQPVTHVANPAQPLPIQSQPIQPVQPVHLPQSVQPIQPLQSPQQPVQPLQTQMYYQNPVDAQSHTLAQQFPSQTFIQNQVPNSVSSVYSTSHGYFPNPQEYSTPQNWRNPNQPPSSVPGDFFQLMIEEKQLHQEMKTTMGTLTSRIHDMHMKLERSNLFQTPVGKSDVSGLVLLQSIQRIIDENEKLKLDLTQKTEYIDTLREKITHLHEKNEKFIEENNRVMEQRNEALKETGEQTRKRLKEILEEKTKLERELNEVSFTLSENNRQYSALNRAHLALKSELSTCQDEVDKKNVDLESMKSASRELNAKLESERNNRLQAESSLENLKNDLELSKRELERAKADLSRERKERLDQGSELSGRVGDMERTWRSERASLEDTVAQLQDALKKQRHESSLILQQEEEKWKSALQERERSLEAALRQEYSTKFAEEKKNIELRSEATLAALKQNHSNEQSSRIQDLENTVENLQNQLAQNALPPSQDTQTETVKKIMNGVYFALYEEFEETELYTGERILQALMKTIKEATLRMLQGGTLEQNGEEEEEEEEAEAEEEEEEEEAEAEEEETEEKEETEVKEDTEKVMEEETEKDAAEAKQETEVEEEAVAKEEAEELQEEPQTEAKEPNEENVKDKEVDEVKEDVEEPESEQNRKEVKDTAEHQSSEDHKVEVGLLEDTHKENTETEDFAAFLSSQNL